MSNEPDIAGIIGIGATTLIGMKVVDMVGKNFEDPMKKRTCKKQSKKRR
jgi:hypothetical protein